jgi:hypothetical protein
VVVDRDRARRVEAAFLDETDDGAARRACWLGWLMKTQSVTDTPGTFEAR